MDIRRETGRGGKARLQHLGDDPLARVLVVLIPIQLSRTGRTALNRGGRFFCHEFQEWS
jgi:hypothetical protein